MYEVNAFRKFHIIYGTGVKLLVCNLETRVLRDGIKLYFSTYLFKKMVLKNRMGKGITPATPGTHQLVNHNAAFNSITCSCLDAIYKICQRIYVAPERRFFNHPNNQTHWHIPPRQVINQTPGTGIKTETTSNKNLHRGLNWLVAALNTNNNKKAPHH